MTQFICPKCQLAQRLPPEMIPFLGPVDPGPGGRRPQPRAQGIDPTKLQLPCASCKAILNVPYGLTRFKCPQCDSDLSIDPGVQLPPPNPFAVPPLAGIRSVGIPILPVPDVPPEPEEINEVGSDNDVSGIDSEYS